MVKVLGHSDRAITTLGSLGAKGGLPRVEKAALVSTGNCTKPGHRRLREGGYYVDPRRRVVLLRAQYIQHAYHPANVLEDRAMSLSGQEIIHPITGQALGGMDVLGMSQDRVLVLQDIVRGEYEGTIIYHGREQLTTTVDTADRLKFLIAWLNKHHNILAEYSSDHFERCLKVIYSYLEDPDGKAQRERHPELAREARQALRDLKWAHRLRLLEKLVKNRADAFGRQFKHVQILIILTHVLGQEGEDLAERHPRQMDKLLTICEGYLKNPYLRRRYLSSEPSNTVEREVVGHYKLLANLVRRFREVLAR